MKPSLRRQPLFLAGIVLLPTFLLPVQAEDITSPFAIAISGGASMGAYEAGLNWGTLYFLRHGEGDDRVLGGETRPVSLVSAAGASAGGINTILSGLTWCRHPERADSFPDRIDDNLFRDVWLSIDINDLLPESPDSPLYLPGDGVLSRHSLVQAAEHLRATWNRPVFQPGCRVPLGVTLTRVEPAQFVINNVQVSNQRFSVPFEMQVGPEGRVAWSFDPTSFDAHRDLAMLLLPERKVQGRDRIDDQAIMDVTLASAAFPIAFGRMRLQYCRPTRNPLKKTGSNRDALHCPEGYEIDEAEFADGGLFDNIPLGLARKLAENRQRKTRHLPVSYLYLDPEPARYPEQNVPASDPCASPTASQAAACRQMAFGLRAQGGLLLDAFGTARRYELFREITDDQWRLNLAVVSTDLLGELNTPARQRVCVKALPWFSQALDCRNTLTWANRLLQTAYLHSQVPLSAPYDLEKLRRLRLVKDCRPFRDPVTSLSSTICTVQVQRYRRALGDALLRIYADSGLNLPDLAERIRRSLADLRNDRKIFVTRRGAPITGTLLGGFGAFLDRQFREYDYYVGIYDAVVLLARFKCSRFFPPENDLDAFHQCFNARAERAWHTLGIDRAPRARLVFALLARDEFPDPHLLPFADQGELPDDLSMRIVHNALQRAREASGKHGADGLFAVEVEFFQYLREQGFTPLTGAGNAAPLLQSIMADPKQWPHELTRRITRRLVYLEQQADRIQAQRETHESQSMSKGSLTPLMAASAYLMQSATYRYPEFDLAPSTAPEDWTWRYLIPYELAFDLGAGDFLLTWQPTWRLANEQTLALRGSLRLQGGVLGRGEITDGDKVDRRHYLSLGIDYTRLTGNTGLSGWGITPTWYHAINAPGVARKNTVGGDLHLGLLRNRLRLSVGVRDMKKAKGSWFVQIGVADIPGMVYWFSRR